MGGMDALEDRSSQNNFAIPCMLQANMVDIYNINVSTNCLIIADEIHKCNNC